MIPAIGLVTGANHQLDYEVMSISFPNSTFCFHDLKQSKKMLKTIASGFWIATRTLKLRLRYCDFIDFCLHKTKSRCCQCTIIRGDDDRMYDNIKIGNRIPELKNSI